MLTCRVCSHGWYPRTSHEPESCPKCGSVRWNRVPIHECPHCRTCPTHGVPSRKRTSTPVPTPEPTPVRRRDPAAQAVLDRFNSISIPDEPQTGKSITPSSTEDRGCTAGYAETHNSSEEKANPHSPCESRERKALQ